MLVIRVHREETRNTTLRRRPFRRVAVRPIPNLITNVTAGNPQTGEGGNGSISDTQLTTSARRHIWPVT